LPISLSLSYKETRIDSVSQADITQETPNDTP
jgi:hypothetical protein